MPTERLQKALARAGIASRRACEAIIAEGRVQVNGLVVTELGVKVDPQHDKISVDGEPVQLEQSRAFTYLMLYKPAGHLSVFSDPRGRPGLEELIQVPERLFAVGRLDLDSEGLMLLTNDGEITQRLSHPRYEHDKTYLVLVNRRPDTAQLARLQRGVQLEEGKTAFSRWRVLDPPPKIRSRSQGTTQEDEQGVWLKVILREGRKRQIRRMAVAEGLHVRRLIRIGLGPLSLDRQLAPGESRPLTRTELSELRRAASRGNVKASRRPSRPERGQSHGRGPGRPEQRRGRRREDRPKQGRRKDR